VNNLLQNGASSRRFASMSKLGESAQPAAADQVTKGHGRAPHLTGATATRANTQPTFGVSVEDGQAPIAHADPTPSAALAAHASSTPA
jgi:hypothetical protein